MLNPFPALPCARYSSAARAWQGGKEETREPEDSFPLEFDLKRDWKGRKEFEQKCRQEGAVNEPFFLLGTEQSA